MSISRRQRKLRRTEKSALQILEESFHLLRTVDLKYYWVFYAGAVPFTVALLYFMADMSRSSLAAQSMLSISLFMVGLTIWLRVTQALFCRGLWRTIQPESELMNGGGDRFRQLAALLAIQALQVPLLILGVILALPLGWIIAFLQNVTALSLTRATSSQPLRNLLSEGLRYSHWEWAQNHGILIVVAFISFFTWVNLVGACLILATFAKSFFGVESVFTTSPLAAIFNTTFALGTILLSYLVLSPILKAIYTLRVFYAQSRSSGEDLLSRLASVKKKQGGEGKKQGMIATKGSRAALLAGLLSVMGLGNAYSEESEERGDPRSAEVALEQSIVETMTQKKYQWQLSRRVEELSAEDQERSWLSLQLYEMGQALREFVKDLNDSLREWFERANREEGKTFSPGDGDSKMFDGLSSALSIGLVLLVVGLVAWLGLLIYRKVRDKDRDESEVGPSAEVVDLHREDIVATELPENEWMRLAEEQIAQGEGRLAVRALFLASLAKLGEEDLLKIARFKSNRDYRIELNRKARKWPELNAAFSENIGLFERTWYGMHAANEEIISDYLGNHEVIGSQSEKAGRSRFVMAGTAPRAEVT